MEGMDRRNEQAAQEGPIVVVRFDVFSNRTIGTACLSMGL